MFVMPRLLSPIELAERMQTADMLLNRTKQVADIQDSAGHII